MGGATIPRLLWGSIFVLVRTRLRRAGKSCSTKHVSARMHWYSAILVSFFEVTCSSDVSVGSQQGSIFMASLEFHDTDKKSMQCATAALKGMRGAHLICHD